MAQLARGQSSLSHPGEGGDIPGPACPWSGMGAKPWAWYGSPTLCCSVLASELEFWEMCNGSRQALLVGNMLDAAGRKDQWRAALSQLVLWSPLQFVFL